MSTVKIKAGDLYFAVIILTRIINEDRPLPQKGKYRIARMHSKLKVEFDTISKTRDDLILSYDYKAIPKDRDGKVVEGAVEQSMVPDDKASEFEEKWKAIAEEEIEVSVEPIPFEQLDLGDSVVGSISANDLLVLGPLVKDPV